MEPADARLRSEIKLRLARQKNNGYASPMAKQRPAWASPTRIESETDDEKKQRLRGEVRVRLMRKENDVAPNKALFSNENEKQEECPTIALAEKSGEVTIHPCSQPTDAPIIVESTRTEQSTTKYTNDENVPPPTAAQDVHETRPPRQQAYNEDKAWAFENLISNYEAQAGIDPETIFNRKFSECDLGKIFERQSISYAKRYSTGDWANDGLTIEELEAYKQECGFKGQLSPAPSSRSSEASPASPPPPPPPPALADIRFSE